MPASASETRPLLVHHENVIADPPERVALMLARRTQTNEAARCATDSAARSSKSDRAA